jgi:hypothetical protein
MTRGTRYCKPMFGDEGAYVVVPARLPSPGSAPADSTHTSSVGEDYKLSVGLSRRVICVFQKAGERHW